MPVVDGCQQRSTVGADLRGVRRTLGLAVRQPVVLHPMAVPVNPLRRHPRTQPLRSGDGQGVKCGPHRFPDQLQAVEHPHRGHHVRGVGARRTPGLEQARLDAGAQYRVQDHPLDLAGQQAGTELAQHGVVEAGVGQLQPQQVLPVDTPAHRVSGLTVGEVLHMLQHRHQRQLPR